MAKKRSVKKGAGKVRYRFLKILCVVTILATCAVLFVGGTQSGVRGAKMLYQCLGATVAIGLVFGVVLKVVSSYEEMKGG